jgi:signal transduction histidine kinase
MDARPDAATQSERLSWTAVLAVGAAGALLAALSALIALSGEMPHKVALAERSALIVATPIAVGLYALRDGTHGRFGRLLILAGAGWFLASLSASSNELVYSVGRVAGPVVEVGLLYLVLAFPSGRLVSSIDRWLVGVAFAVAAVAFLPIALLSESYPTPSLWTTCDADCPGNAFMLASSEPALLEDGLIRFRDLVLAAITLAVVVRLASRVAHGTRLLRKTLTPVLVFAMLRTLVLALGLAFRGLGGENSVVQAATVLVGLGLPAICIGFLLGLLRWRIHMADCFVQLALALPRTGSGAERRDLIAATLSDPTVDLVFRRDDRNGGWSDAGGHPVSLPQLESERAATLISEGGKPVAALIHDPALSEQRPFIEAVGAYAVVWDDNRRLAARVESSLVELRKSRARILAAADDERRRIERDLHDGGQQRLVALRIRLELADDMMLDDPVKGREMLHRLGDDVDAALEELRSLAAGVYPSLLAARGLHEAIRTAALQSPLETTVEVDGSDRYPDEVETAAYFCCIEALQNAAKHAAGASGVAVALSCNGDLRFEVRDDGDGFDVDEVASGDGLLNMRDRLASVGGELEIRSAPGTGTTVIGTIPLDES